MKSKFIRKVSLCLVLMFSLSYLGGCAGGEKSPVVSNNEDLDAVKEYTEPTINTEKAINMSGIWSKTPEFNGNYFNPGGNSTMNYFLYERLFIIIRVGTGQQYNQLAETVEHTESQTIINLREDVKWHDGEPFTSKDIWAFYMMRGNVDAVKYMDSIETPDDNTLVFNWSEPYIIEDMRMRLIAKDVSGTVPYHIYHEYVDAAAEMIENAQAYTDINKRRGFGIEFTKDELDAYNKNYTDMTNYIIPVPIGTGPYKFESVDDNNYFAVKNEDYYDADKVHFEKIKMVASPSDLAQSNAMLRNGEYDIAWGSPTQDILESTLASNPDLVYYRQEDLASYGILFNTRMAPFDNVEFRKAMAYVVDKTKVRQVGNYYAQEYPEISAAGLPPSYLDEILLPDTKLTDFSRDEAKAVKILEDLGWTRGNDGMWADPQGKKPEFIIAADAAQSIQLNSGQVVAEQLTEFGLSTKVQAVETTVYFPQIKEGENYHMAFYLLDMNWNMNEPWDGLNNAYTGNMKEIGGFPEEHLMPNRDGDIINTEHEIDRYIYTKDKDERLKILNDLIYVYNENVYAINMFQTAYGTYINTKNVAGFLPMEAELDEHDRNMPFATDSDVNDRICELNMGYQSNRFFVDGTYWPR